jgi:cation:H+ antiporter
VIDTLYLIGGLALLYFGAEWLVGGAARLAESFGVAKLIVGLTVVAYGTSSPELVVGIGAAVRDQGDIALGNVIGSNIANLGLILAVSTLIVPPAIDPALRRREVWVLAGSAALVPITLVDGAIAWWEGAGLLALAAIYTAWMVWSSRAAPADLGIIADIAEDAALAPHQRSRARNAVIAVAGLALLIAGGHLLVDGAVGLARRFGLSERLIGLTIVAIGTSLPELATSVIAALRGHSDLAVGNVIGSNIFNVLLILGASGVTGAIATPLSAITFDLAVLGAMTAVAAVVILARERISRVEAMALLVGYVAFLSTLALTASAD